MSKNFIFEVDENKQIINGKAQWEHYLKVYMPRREAFYVLRFIANQLECTNDKDVPVSLNFAGLLEESGE